MKLHRMLLLVGLVAAPLAARDSLGMFGQWGAFKDAQVPRCYALAMAAPSTMQRDFQPYADVAFWPKQNVRGQVHFRLSRKLQPGAPISLQIGNQRIGLTGGGGDAWAPDPRGDAAIVAAMRSASEMTVSARGADGRGFSNTWDLKGAATAIDAAMVGCAGAR
ncbi:hypothetical protein [Novosphingobium sp. B 225]|uniref:hypothetical protein n=1 Tax=Novosphingobium sp. B 225 TaxID=1961849 RepID=UPI000B4ACB02|nr:hypothetical protein [Novosphingobium sp. B 225]